MKTIQTFFITVFLISLSLSIFQIFPITLNKSFGQVQEFTSPSPTTSDSEAVTSTNDAIIKSILIISQVSVLGLTFNHFLFQILLKKSANQRKYLVNKNEFIYQDISYEKRFTKLVSLCATSVILASTGTILLQAFELSQQLQLDMYTAFTILYSASVGQVWILRLTTSIIIVGLAIAYYLLKKRRSIKNIQNQKKVKKIITKFNINTSSIALFAIIIIVSINLFSNSMVSHSNALKYFSSLAVSIDWLHLVAVSVWIGGLFYISTVLLKKNKTITDNNYNILSNSNYDTNNQSISRNNYQISILLTYFSFIAIVSLSIIGITGLYLALVHLQSLSAIFNTFYGNILIIKLSLAFPMILIGRYNQIKIQNYLTLSKKIKINNENNNLDSNIYVQDNKKRENQFIAINKSIKIESLIGISVLVVASFLSITSPPSLATTTNQVTNESNSNSINISTNANNLGFFVIIIILSVIIAIIGLLNFRKNQRKVKDIYA
jgi:copper transport protein